MRYGGVTTLTKQEVLIIIQLIDERGSTVNANTRNPRHHSSACPVDVFSYIAAIRQIYIITELRTVLNQLKK